MCVRTGALAFTKDRKYKKKKKKKKKTVHVRDRTAVVSLTCSNSAMYLLFKIQ